jgi:peptide/nickel transport system substrate-binding protein
MIISDVGSATDVDPGTNPNFMWNLGILETMVDVTPNGTLIPGLATSWENVNGTSWIFHLRTNVKFHDGKNMTAYDVKYSFNRTMSKSASAKKYLNIIACNVIDDHTVELVTKEPDAAMPGRMTIAQAVIYSNASVENDKGAIKTPIGTGPFKFAGVEANTGYMTLERFDDYYNGTAALKKIIMKYGISDANAREMAIEKGEVDLIVEPPLASTSRMENNSDLTVYTYDWHGSYKLIFANLTKEPFNDVRVRQALAYAIDRENIANNVLLDRGSVSNGNGVPNFVPWYNSSIVGYSYNVTKAKQLLSDAGWKDTDGDGILDKNGKKFELTLYSANGNPACPEIAPVIQSEFKDIGISVDVQVLDSSAIASHNQEWGYVYISYEVPLYMRDPSYYPETQYMTGGVSNAFKYSNSKVDALLLQARSEFNVTKRYQIYEDVQAIIVDECPTIVFDRQRYCVVTRSDLVGYVPYAVAHNSRLNKDMHFV